MLELATSRVREETATFTLVTNLSVWLRLVVSVTADMRPALDRRGRPTNKERTSDNRITVEFWEIPKVLIPIIFSDDKYFRYKYFRYDILRVIFLKYFFIFLKF